MNHKKRNEELALFDEVLTDITAILGDQYGTLMIAGGAVRDHQLDKLIKDIDVWLIGDPLEIFNKLKGQYPEGTVSLAWGMLYGSLESDMAGIINFHGTAKFLGDEEDHDDPYSKPVQIIVLKPEITDVISRFDFGVCRASYDLKNGFTLTDEFLIDVAHKTFTLISDHDEARSLQRFFRLTDEKFEGWELA